MLQISNRVIQKREKKKFVIQMCDEKQEKHDICFGCKFWDPKKRRKVCEPSI